MESAVAISLLARIAHAVEIQIFINGQSEHVIEKILIRRDVSGGVARCPGGIGSRRVDTPVDAYLGLLQQDGAVRVVGFTFGADEPAHRAERGENNNDREHGKNERDASLLPFVRQIRFIMGPFLVYEPDAGVQRSAHEFPFTRAVTLASLQPDPDCRSRGVALCLVLHQLESYIVDGCGARQERVSPSWTRTIRRVRAPSPSASSPGSAPIRLHPHFRGGT